MNKVCIVGASGKLGQYMVQQALDRGYEVVGVCREKSVGKLEAFKGRMTIVPGATNDPEVIKKAVAGCDGVLTVLVPGALSSTGREPRRPCSTMRSREHASSIPVVGTSPAMARTSIPGSSGPSWRSLVGWRA